MYNGIGDKIKYYRKQRRLSQEALAVDICDKSLISKIENNAVTPSDELLRALKECLGIEAAISPEEVEALKIRLFNWYNLIKERQFDEAAMSQAELRTAVDYSREIDLEIFYDLFEVRLMLLSFKDNKDMFEEKFKRLSDKDSLFSDKQRYYYLYFYGYYKNVLGQFREALNFLLKAEELGKSLDLYESFLYGVVASIFSRLHCIPKAIVYGMAAFEISRRSLGKEDLIEIEGTLAINYNRIGEYRRAEELLTSALHLAKTKNDKNLIGILYHNLACTYCKLEMFDKSLQNFKTALTYHKPEEYLYVNNILWISYMLIEKGDIFVAIEWADKGIPLAKNFNDLYILLNTIRHSQNLAKPNSLNYIENTAMPLLIEKGMYFKAIEYADSLKKFFLNKRRYKDALKYSELAESFHKIILLGEG